MSCFLTVRALNQYPMRRRFVLFFLLMTVLTNVVSAKPITTINRLINKQMALTEPIDYHITSSEVPLEQSTIDINHEDAWVFFDNIRPQVVINNLLGSIKINGAAIVNNVNARVTLYKHGTVIIPHKSSYKPLTVYSGENLTGESVSYGLGYFKTLALDNDIRSFVLKRGYMATMANNADGTGYSRSFVAQDADEVFTLAPDPLYGRISSIRVVQWKYVSKKGWCTTDGNIDWQAGLVDATWCYTWSADRSSTNNLEYIPIKQHLYWPGWDQIYNLNGNTGVLGYNEPDHSEQHDGQVYTAEMARNNMNDYLKTGVRVGSPSPTDRSWISSYIGLCDAAAIRVDFVAMHAYWGGLTPQNWYNNLKAWYDATKRPLWITEWNNGANWTSESWPTGTEAQQAKQLADLKGILYVLDTASFVERYSIYDWVEDKRAMQINGKLTPAGEYYKNNKPDLAYNPAMQVIPKVPAISTPTFSKSLDPLTGNITFTLTDKNGELTDYITLQKMLPNGLYTDVAILPERAFDLGGTTVTYVHTPTDEERDGAYYRFKYTHLNGKVLYSAALGGNYYADDAWSLNDQPDGDYYLVNAATGQFLTDNGGTTPVYADKTDTGNQVWTLFKDTTGRYKISAKASSAFLTENARFGTDQYYPTWNSYEILRKKGSDSIAIQNGDKAGTHFWTTTATTITGKGSTSMPGFPFRLMPINGPGFLPTLRHKNTTYQRAIDVQAGDSLVLDPQALNTEGNWLWNTGATTDSLPLDNVQQSASYTVTHTLGEASSRGTYEVTVYTINTLSDGYYYLQSQTDGSYLTNDGTSNPLFTNRTPASENARIWFLKKDPTSQRYMIQNCDKGRRHLNENGRFAATTFNPALHTFNLYNPVGTNVYALRNDSNAGTHYWVINGSLITGKGSSTLKGYAFTLVPAQPTLTLYPYINTKATDSLVVTTGTAVTLQPAASLPGGSWRWDNGDTTATLSVTQTGSYRVTYRLNNDSVTTRFKVEFHQANTLPSGTYYLKNAQEGSYLTYTGTSYPEFLGKELFDVNKQLWSISKDAATGRYKISSVANPAFFLDEYGRYNGGTYYATWNSVTLYNQQGSSLYAIQNGGSAGTNYWRIAANTLRGKGTPSLAGFPFEIVDPATDPVELAASAMISLNQGDYILTNKVEAPLGSTVNLKLYVTRQGGRYYWNTGDTTQVLTLTNVQTNDTLTATYIQGSDTLSTTFTIYTFELNGLPNGDYHIVNESTGKYLSYVSAGIKPSFSTHYPAVAQRQAWTFTLDPSVNRYNIRPVMNPSCLLTATADLAIVTYDKNKHSYELYGETTSELVGFRNGGSSGNAFWTASASNINGSGSTSPVYPFRLVPYQPSSLPGTWSREAITLWPNPVETTFELSLPEAATFTLVSLDGKVLFTKACQAGQNTLSMEQYPAGSYLGRINAGGNQVIVKLVKQ